MDVLVPAGVGVGVAVALETAVGVGEDARVGFAVGSVVSEGAGVKEMAGIGVGEIKIIFIALSSGMGERIFLPETRTPTTIATSTIIPTMNVMAARVRLRSSIF